MGEDTKVREVRTEFTARDAGLGATVNALAGVYEASAKKLGGLRDRFSEFRQETGLNVAALLGVGLSVGAFVHRAKEANAEVLNTQKSLAGVLSGAIAFERGTSEIDKYNRSLVVSKKTTSELDDIGTRFVRGLGEVSQAYQVLLAGAGRYGLSQKQVVNLTEGATAAAKRYGGDASTAAMKVASAIEKGKVVGFDPFSLALRGAVGDMTKLTSAARFDRINRALKGSVDIADQMSGGMDGALARIQGTTNDLIRDLTTPVFTDIAKSIEGWAKHLKEAKVNGQPLIDQYAHTLVDAFRELKNLSQFIREHWVAIAAIAGGIKGGALLGQLGGKLSGLAGGSKGAGPLAEAGRLAGGLGGVLEVAGKVAPALSAIAGAAGLAAIALKGVWDEYQTRKSQAADLGGFFDEIGKVARAQRDMQRFAAKMGPADADEAKGFMREHAAAAAEVLKQKGLLDEQGALNRDRFNAVMDSASADVRAKFAENFKGLLGDVSGGMLGAFAAETFGRHYVTERAGTGKDDSLRPLAKNITNIYGGLHLTMKVEEADPDRVFVRFERGLDEMVDRRGQAIGAEPQGM